jgi:hypothetical protein
METNKAERLEGVAATLNDLIALAREAGLNDTAQFLAMAKLNLLIEINGITDGEFRAFCAALEGKSGTNGKRRARPMSLRVRHVDAPEDSSVASQSVARASQSGVGARRTRARHAIASRRVSRAIN